MINSPYIPLSEQNKNAIMQYNMSRNSTLKNLQEFKKTTRIIEKNMNT